MGLSADQTFAIAGMLLGVTFLLSLLAPHVIHFYVPELHDWNYAASFTVNYPNYAVGYWYLTRIPVNSGNLRDANFWSTVSPDCNDIRVTLVHGGKEYLLPTYIERCKVSHKQIMIWVDVPVLSRQQHFRLYFGNPSAPALPAVGHTDWYHPRYTRDAVVTPSSGARYTVKNSRVSVDSGAVRVEFTARAPEYYASAFGTRFKLLRPSAFLFVPTSECNVSSDVVLAFARGESNTISTCSGYFLIQRDSRHVDVIVIRNGSPVSSVSRYSRARSSQYVSITPRVAVAHDPSASLFDPPLMRLYAFGYTVVELPRTIDRWVVYMGDGAQINNTDLHLLRSYPGAHFGHVSMAPRAPSIAVSAPSDYYFRDSAVPLSFTITDPNDDLDLNATYVSVDSNVYTPASHTASYTGTVSLLPGEHTILVHVEDFEGAVSERTISVFVDPVAPALDVNASPSYDENTLYLRISITDISPVAVAITRDDVNFSLTVVPDENTATVSPTAITYSVDSNTTVSIPASEYTLDLNVPLYVGDYKLCATDPAGNATCTTVTVSPPPEEESDHSVISDLEVTISAPATYTISRHSTPLSVTVTPAAAGAYVGAIVLGLIALRVLAVI